MSPNCTTSPPTTGHHTTCTATHLGAPFQDPLPLSLPQLQIINLFVLHLHYSKLRCCFFCIFPPAILGFLLGIVFNYEKFKTKSFVNFCNFYIFGQQDAYFYGKKKNFPGGAEFFSGSSLAESAYPREPLKDFTRNVHLLCSSAFFFLQFCRVF